LGQFPGQPQQSDPPQADPETDETPESSEIKILEIQLVLPDDEGDVESSLGQSNPTSSTPACPAPSPVPVHPSLSTQRRPPANSHPFYQQQQQQRSPAYNDAAQGYPRKAPVKKMRRVLNCGNCVPCLTLESCGTCITCQTPEWKQKCERRRCVLLPPRDWGQKSVKRRRELSPPPGQQQVQHQSQKVQKEQVQKEQVQQAQQTDEVIFVADKRQKTVVDLEPGEIVQEGLIVKDLTDGGLETKTEASSSVASVGVETDAEFVEPVETIQEVVSDKFDDDVIDGHVEGDDDDCVEEVKTETTDVRVKVVTLVWSKLREATTDEPFEDVITCVKEVKSRMDGPPLVMTRSRRH